MEVSSENGDEEGAVEIGNFNEGLEVIEAVWMVETFSYHDELAGEIKETERNYGLGWLMVRMCLQI